MSEKSYPHKKPEKLSENLWHLHGEWSNPLGRRMTVVRLKSGELVIHNAFRLQPDEMTWLFSLGTPAYIIAPNHFHCSDAGWMMKKCPGAKLFVPQSRFKDFETQGITPLDVNTQFPEKLKSEIQCIPMEGTKMHEAAFFHVPSRTLILCDLAFNMPDVFKGIVKVIMKWNKVGGRFGPSRLTKLFFTKDKKKLIASYEKLIQLDFDRVIVNHGEILNQGGRDLLKSSVGDIFGR